MKKFFLVIIFCFLLNSLFSQPIEIYYDEDFNITMKEFASFKRVWESNLILNTKFIDFDNEGFKICEGSYLDSVKEGDFVFYYLKSRQILSKGKYLNNKMTDVWEFYYEGGQLKYKIQFINDDFYVLSSFDSLGQNLIVNGTGPFRYEFVNSNNDTINITGNFLDKKKAGDWVYMNNKKILAKEIYELGKFKKGYLYDINFQDTRIKDPLITNIIFENTDLNLIEENHYSNLLYREDYPFFSFLPQHPDTSVFNVILGNAVGLIENQQIMQIEQPKYPGGEVEFKKLYSINVLRTAIESFIDDGKFYLSFDIDTIGIPRNFIVMRAPNKAFEIATLNSLKNIKRWLPAKYEGKPIKSKMNYTIKFKVVF